MGGASEDDNAMKWFLQRADGGDILVLRTSGSDGYNDYLYSDLGVTVNSVETIVCHDPSASDDAYVHQKIQQAEAIWFAGGDQWNYISYWRNTPVDSLINLSIQQRNLVIGGTSAGMAILGKYYFSAQNGTVTSATALSNPFHNKVKVDSASFIQNSTLAEVITDTHFDNPDRKGRLTTFLARIYADYGIPGKAIACDEYTAVCIDTSGIAKVYGGYPSYDDNAYFIQTNCELPDQAPEVCASGIPLTWNLGGKAIKVYRVKGTSAGSNTFNLNDWQTGAGGEWFDWHVNNGVFAEQSGTAIHCPPFSVDETILAPDLRIFPNPASDNIIISSEKFDLNRQLFEIYNFTGQKMPVEEIHRSGDKIEIDISHYASGLYFLRITENGSGPFHQIFIKH